MTYGSSTLCQEQNRAFDVFHERKLKACRFVERVLDIHHELQQDFGMLLSDGMIQNMGVEEMVEAAFRFLTMRYELSKIPHQSTTVDIGYHYTQRSNLPSIIRSGLLSRDELEQFKINPACQTGTNCGRGIYVAADPISFASQGYGRLCVMTARGLWGKCVRLEDSMTDYSRFEADTILIRPNDYRQFSVLKRSVQCLPMICFELSLRDHDSMEHKCVDISAHRKIIFEYHKRLQALLDDILEQGDTKLPMKAFGLM